MDPYSQAETEDAGKVIYGDPEVVQAVEAESQEDRRAVSDLVLCSMI